MDLSIFAIELCYKYDPALHSILRDHVKTQAQSATLGYHEKWVAYRNCESDLLANLDRVDRGCWDYFNDDERAKNDFTMWVNGMITDETARTTPSGQADPYRDDPRYMTFTMALLIRQDTPTDAALFALCNIPQDKLWEKAVFTRILQGLGVINFASVQGDVMYVIPRDEDYALDMNDMSNDKFAYLRPLY
jgi:hypothetical protein